MGAQVFLLEHEEGTALSTRGIVVTSGAGNTHYDESGETVKCKGYACQANFDTLYCARCDVHLVSHDYPEEAP